MHAEYSFSGRADETPVPSPFTPQYAATKPAMPTASSEGYGGGTWTGTPVMSAAFTNSRQHQYPPQYQQPFYSQQQQQQQQPAFFAQSLVNDPLMQNMAMEYGQSVLGQGRQAVASSVEKYMSISRLKYYFSVDTAYVTRKLRLLFFPFANSDWSIRYNSEEPIQPRHEVNAPDLYIPVMAFVTYILVAGFLLGRQQRFTPELLGMQFSSALAWLLLEVLVVLLTIYILNTNTALKTFDIVAFSGYKYVCVCVVLLSSLFVDGIKFLCVMLYCCCMCSLFLARTLKVQLQPVHEQTAHPGGVKRRTYVLLLMSGLQAPLIYWLSHHLVRFSDASP